MQVVTWRNKILTGSFWASEAASHAGPRHLQESWISAEGPNRLHIMFQIPWRTLLHPAFPLLGFFHQKLFFFKDNWVFFVEKGRNLGFFSEEEKKCVFGQ